MSAAGVVPGYLVRVARDTDHQAIRELTVGVYVGEGYAGPHYVPTLADVEGRAAHTELLVADGGGQVVGAVALAASGGPYAELAGPGEAVFRMLVVDPQWRGRGVAQALVQACLERARSAGCQRMVISTEPIMHAAHRLYQRMGFARDPGRDWTPVPGVDLLAYVIDL
ncbi:MAG: GNAT family N-acetyltransferase [Mycobacteriales bacterium]